MKYAWSRSTTAHILDEKLHTLCKVENSGWRPLGRGKLPNGIRKVCGNCERVAEERAWDEDEAPPAAQVKTAEAAQILKLEAKIRVLEKDVERLLGQINPNEELERMAAIRGQLSAPD